MFMQHLYGFYMVTYFTSLWLGLTHLCSNVFELACEVFISNTAKGCASADHLPSACMKTFCYWVGILSILGL